MEVFSDKGIDLYRFESPYIGTNIYVIIKEFEVLIINPHKCPNAEELFKAKAVTNATVF